MGSRPPYTPATCLLLPVSVPYVLSTHITKVLLLPLSWEGGRPRADPPDSVSHCAHSQAHRTLHRGVQLQGPQGGPPARTPALAARPALAPWGSSAHFRLSSRQLRPFRGGGARCTPVWPPPHPTRSSPGHLTPPQQHSGPLTSNQRHERRLLTTPPHTGHTPGVHVLHRDTPSRAPSSALPSPVPQGQPHGSHLT